MRVRILGPFQVGDGGRRIAIDGVRQRAVLADLVLHANEVVPSEQLLVELWGEDSPASAANALQAAISRLRKVLPAGRLITTASGYMLRVFPAELDVAQFGQLIFEGRDALAAGAAAEAMQLLDQALTLWRGSPLIDFRYEPFAQAEIARLEELQLACLEERNEANLALGSAGALTAELGRMVSDHPLRERLRGQLMLALYRSGGRPKPLRPTASSEARSWKSWVWNRRRRCVNSMRRSCARPRSSRRAGHQRGAAGSQACYGALRRIADSCRLRCGAGSRGARRRERARSFGPDRRPRAARRKAGRQR